jgi:hypothetical protein
MIRGMSSEYPFEQFHRRTVVSADENQIWLRNSSSEGKCPHLRNCAPEGWVLVQISVSGKFLIERKLFRMQKSNFTFSRLRQQIQGGVATLAESTSEFLP